MLRVSDTQPNAGPWKNCMGVLGGRREVREGWREGRMGVLGGRDGRWEGSSAFAWGHGRSGVGMRVGKSLSFQ